MMGCHKKDLHHQYLQFAIIMAARKANENLAQGNALGFYVLQ